MLNLPLWAEHLAVFDTETTGVSPQTARIVSASLALIGGDGAPTERYDWLINPGIEIPEQAAQVHGITTEIAQATGMEPRAAIEQMNAGVSDMLARGYPLVVFNAPYDLTLLRAESIRHGAAFPEAVQPVIDPLIIDRQVDRYRKGKRTLIAMAEHYSVSLENAHDAGADAIAAGQVAQAIARLKGAELPGEPMELHQLQITWAQAQAESFQAYMRRVKDPSFVADGAWPLR